MTKIDIIAWRKTVFLDDSLNSSEKLVACCLAEYYRHDKPCYPSQETLGECCNLCENTIRAALSNLKLKRYIKFDKKRIARNRFMSTAYEFLPCPFEGANEPSNGVPSNGVPSNGVPSNGVPSNAPSNAPSNEGGEKAEKHKSLISVDKKEKVQKEKTGLVKDNPPVFEEFESFCLSLGITCAKRIYDGYAVANWHDAQGRPIRNWKQKIHQVWDKPENKRGLGGGQAPPAWQNQQDIPSWQKCV